MAAPPFVCERCVAKIIRSNSIQKNISYLENDIFQIHSSTYLNYNTFLLIKTTDYHRETITIKTQKILVFSNQLNLITIILLYGCSGRW